MMIARKKAKVIVAVVLALVMGANFSALSFAEEYLEPTPLRYYVQAFTVITANDVASGRTVINVPSAYSLSYDSTTGFCSVSVDVSSALSGTSKAYINCVYLVLANYDGVSYSAFNLDNYLVDFTDFRLSSGQNGHFSGSVSSYSYYPNCYDVASDVSNNYLWYYNQVELGKISAFVWSNVGAKSPIIGNSSNFNYGSNSVINVSKSFDNIDSGLAVGLGGFYIFADGTISFKFRFSINDVIVSLGDASNKLGNLADDLAVSTPNIDVDSLVDDALSEADMESVGEVWAFMNNHIVTTMLLITVTMALLGYILYGKKEAGGSS